MEKWFSSIKQAKEFIEKNKITNYEFHTPEFLENGVELSWEKDDERKVDKPRC